MTAATVAAAAVPTTSAVETSTTTATRVSVEAAAASYATTACESATSGIATSVAASIASAISVAAISVTTAEPWASADKEAAIKPGRAIVTIRGTGVGGVSVITPLAHGCAIIAAITVAWADANPQRNLSVRVGGWNHQNTKQREIP